MNIIRTKIEGVVIIEPQIFIDSRGYFFESFSQREFDEKVAPIRFVQDNESKSSYGVTRLQRLSFIISHFSFRPKAAGYFLI